MIINFGGVEYAYDTAAIDVHTAIKIKEHTGLGIRSWERAVDDADPVALQALLWVVKKQNGENVPIRTLNFSVVDFFAALTDASVNELKARAAEAAAAAGEEETDPTVTADA